MTFAVVKHQEDVLRPEADVLAKLEFFNPAGSVKDRIGFDLTGRQVVAFFRHRIADALARQEYSQQE